MNLSRRGLIGSLLAAPAIIRTPGLLMPISAPRFEFKTFEIGYVIDTATGEGIELDARTRALWNRALADSMRQTKMIAAANVLQRA